MISVLSAALTKPPCPVSAMVGNSAARALSTLAFAAASCASASRMSGRCNSKSDGRPGDTRCATMPLRLPPRTVTRAGASPSNSASVAMFWRIC